MFCEVNILLFSSLANIITASVRRQFGARWVGGSLDKWSVVGGRLVGGSVGRWLVDLIKPVLMLLE